jgi:hypothetical protein
MASEIPKTKLCGSGGLLTSPSALTAWLSGDVKTYHCYGIEDPLNRCVKIRWDCWVSKSKRLTVLVLIL